MASDILHHGHIIIIKTAAQYGEVVVGLLTDDAIRSYKRSPIIEFRHRKFVVENIKVVHSFPLWCRAPSSNRLCSGRLARSAPNNA
jgi:cytidyltransferase-like protein